MENTYYAGLQFWSLIPDEWRIQSDVVMEWTRPSRLLFAQIWVGYDHGGNRERRNSEDLLFLCRPARTSRGSSVQEGAFSLRVSELGRRL